MRRLVFILVVTACALSSARAAININTETVKRSVVFIYVAGPDGKADTSAPDATGFLVSVPTTDTPPKYYWLLVTARHVFDPQWTGCSKMGANPEKVFVRVDTLHFDPAKDATGVDYIELDLVSGGKRLFAVSSDDSDAAAIVMDPARFDVKKYLLNTIQMADFGTDDEMKKLRIGDDVVSAGLMPFYAGVKRNYPIFKFGKVSDVPDEDVPVPCGLQGTTMTIRHPMKEVLIAANLFPGSSGSPIFFVPPGGNGVSLGGGSAFLAGLQSNWYGPGVAVAGMTPVQAICDAISNAIEAMHLPNANLHRGR